MAMNFDWVTMKKCLYREDWPTIADCEGYDVGNLTWAGHNVYVILRDIGPQRLGMGKPVPGAFGGGNDTSFVLVDVREAGSATRSPDLR